MSVKIRLLWLSRLALALIMAMWLINPAMPALAQVTNPQTGSIGLSGTIPTAPPSVGATISFPVNGQTFDEIPITVTGICPKGLLVKLFKNQVFTGSVNCADDGTFSIKTDLFNGSNELVARVFDSLDQPGPDSNLVKVTYQNIPEEQNVDQLILTSNFALRGANAGEELVWPLAVAGGTRPYAINVDWGDGETTQLPLELAGNFSVKHTYFEPGVYKIVIKAADSRIQLVGVANGPSAQSNDQSDSGVASAITRSFIIPLWPLYVMFFFVVSTFWLGRKYELKRIKDAVRKGKAVQL